MQHMQCIRKVANYKQEFIEKTSIAVCNCMYNWVNKERKQQNSILTNAPFFGRNNESYVSFFSS
jgi:hypothetical protein